MKNLSLSQYYKKFVYGNNLNSNDIANLLNKEKIVIADIGSTGGLDSKWFFLNDFVKKYSFDPDSRAENNEEKIDEVFNFGLWSSDESKEIFLTRFPSASSIFAPNKILLDRFLNHECHDVIGKAQVKMTTLDSILKDGRILDFIKVDTEGADLEILLGSTKAIKATVVGIQVEVQFVERNIGSPMFADLDPVIRGDGYWLMELKRQSWIRKNNIYNIDAVPQLIWADAIYMITEFEACKRAQEIEPSNRFLFLSKIVLIAIAYGYMDYAAEIAESFFRNKLISKEEEQLIRRQIIKSLRSNSVILAHSLLVLILAFIGSLISKLFNIKKDFFSYHLWFSYKKFFDGLSKIYSRHGPNKVAIGDGY